MDAALVADSALAQKFRDQVEGRLEVAVANNPRVMVSWELGSALDRVVFVCNENFFEERLIGHISTSLTRMLSVGRRMGLVDKDVSTVTLECVPQDGSTPLFVRQYELDG